jgi:hypothetical protein
MFRPACAVALKSLRAVTPGARPKRGSAALPLALVGLSDLHFVPKASPWRSGKLEQSIRLEPTEQADATCYNKV